MSAAKGSSDGHGLQVPMVRDWASIWLPALDDLWDRARSGWSLLVSTVAFPAITNLANGPMAASWARDRRRVWLGAERRQRAAPSTDG